MDDKKALNVLLGLLDKNLLSKKEREAVNAAIGILGWSSLYREKIKALGKARKAKLDKDSK